MSVWQFGLSTMMNSEQQSFSIVLRHVTAEHYVLEYAATGHIVSKDHTIRHPRISKIGPQHEVYLLITKDVINVYVIFLK
jgi:hypothetical protein